MTSMICCRPDQSSTHNCESASHRSLAPSAVVLHGAVEQLRIPLLPASHCMAAQRTRLAQAAVMLLTLCAQMWLRQRSPIGVPKSAQ